LPPAALNAVIEVATPNAVDTELDPPETTGFCRYAMLTIPLPPFPAFSVMVSQTYSIDAVEPPPPPPP
jgi:hypothetical protein